MLFLFLLFLLASPTSAFTAPLAPSEDPFYEIPENVSEYEVGQIMGWRPPPVQLRSEILPLNIKDAWQLQVRSEDSFGNPTSVVTTIVEPYNADPTKILSYQSFEDLPSVNCSPSYGILFGASMDTFPTQWEMTIMDVALLKNWYVVLPDHQGPKSAFTAGLQSGQAVLNGIRAALNSGNLTGIDPDARVGLYGYSGGSIASGWAAQIQPDYAPELKKNIVGSAFGGVMTNHTQTLIENDETAFAGLVVSMIHGLSQEYEALIPIIEKAVDPGRLHKFNAARNMCLGEISEKFIYEELFNGSNPLIQSSLLANPEMAAVLHNNTLGLSKSAGVPEVPIFMFQALHDEVIRVNQAEEVYEKWCSWGAPSIEFAVSNYSAHVSEGILGIGTGLAWLEKRMNGEKPIDGCTRTYRTTNTLYPGADVMIRQYLDTFVRAIFGQRVGEETENFTESTVLSKIFAYTLNGVFRAFGPFKRHDGEGSKISEKPQNKLFHGFRDIIDLWESEGIDPWGVLYGETTVLFEA